MLRLLVVIFISHFSFASEPVKVPHQPVVTADKSHATEPAKSKNNQGHSDSHHVEEGVDSAQALKWLQNGNLRFLKGHFRKDGKNKSDIERLTKGQKPHTIVLSCADSRVPPEHVFDQGLGEIFVVRVAGQGLDSSVIASVEYAVEHLGAKLIVVMGHTYCGAVKAAISTPEGKSAGSPDLDELVKDLKPRVSSFKMSDDVADASKANAIEVAKDLMKRSKIVSEHVKSGKVKLTSSLYQLKSGRVEWLTETAQE